MSDRISFLRAELLDALRMVSHLRPWRRDDRRPALIQIDACDGLARLTSSDLEMMIDVPLPCSPGSATMFVPLVQLTGAAEKSTVGEIDLIADGETTTFVAGRFRSKMSGLPQDAAPIRSAVGGAPNTMSAGALRNGLQAASPATIADASRPFLGGVYLHNTATGLSFVAMDGTRVHAATEAATRVHAATILPDALVDLLLVALPEDGDVMLTIGDRGILIEWAGASINSTLITTAFPAYDDQLAVMGDRVLRGRADQLLADIDLVAVVANRRDRDVRLDLGPICEASAFRYEGSGGQAGAVQMLAEFQGAPMAIGFQIRLLNDALSLFGREMIEWRMRGPTDPTIVTCPNRPGLKAMISPFLLAAEHQRILA